MTTTDMKTITDKKKEYLNPTISVLEVECNGMLLAGSAGTDTQTEVKDQYETGFYPDKEATEPL